MNTNEQNDNLQKIIPILTDENYLEWKLQMIICLKQRRLYQCIPGDGVNQMPTEEAKIVDTNVEACGLITNFLDSRTFAALVTTEKITQNSYLLWKRFNERFASSTFNSMAIIWSKFQKLTYNNNLKDFIANTWKCLNKATLNAETQGNPNAIFNVLHEANLKEEALLADATRALILKKDSFPSKFVHYCSNGKHNPLVTTYGPEKCWQLHPELKPEKKRKDKEQKANFTIARALLTHEPRETNTSITIVLDTGASNHMFNNKSFFKNLDTNHCTKVATGCDKSTLISQGKGLAKIVDRLDGGGEFINKSFKNLCAKSGINHTISPPYTPQHNPFAERGNWSILEKARCILLQSQLPIKFWAEAVSTATFLCNRIPKHDNHRAPYEIWHNSKPPIHRLKPFGCKALLKIPTNSIKNKFYSKAWDGIFLGYENEALSYFMLRLSEQKIIISRHLLFDEEKFPSLPAQKQFSKDIVRIFFNPIQTADKETQIDFNIEESSSNVDANSISSENEETYVDTLEQQPKRIRVIDPRHPTLISSEIDSNNILLSPKDIPEQI
ncbi:hypothetical protein O181_073488 [Austropuccinia psidii MF-1]|uniref:Integrase catalytic domain-containing protein n=1 Tax=Austropuccinia psidii MF-1 TaxID=1389203 RepID=A0A9Q3F977_9BASI|nr:hypothetical protein [Austropuccinia psidii MF-1]